MPIVSSTHTLGHAQRDGRRYVTERHTDHTGRVHVREYLAAPGVDTDALMAAQAAALGEQLRADQLTQIESDLFERGVNPFPANNGDFDHVTRAEALGWLLGRHIDDPAEVIVKVAPLMAAVTDAEMLALGMTVDQVNGIRARVDAAVQIKAQIDAYNASLVTA